MSNRIVCNSTRTTGQLSDLWLRSRGPSLIRLWIGVKPRHAICAVLALTILSWTMLLSVHSHAQQPEIQRLEPAQVGQNYHVQLVASGGVAPLTWSIVGGALPPGVQLSVGGMLSGPPTTGKPDPYVFTVEVADSSPTPQRYQMALSMLVGGSMFIVPPSLAAAAIGPGAGPSPTPKAESNADKVSIAVTQDFDNVDSSGNSFFPNDSSKLNDAANKNELIAKTLGKQDSEALVSDLYCIVHAVRWSQRSGNAGTPKFDSDDHWYLLINHGTMDHPKWETDPLSASHRLLGRRSVAVLLIHLGALPKWDIKYDVSVTEQTPQNVTNLMTLLGVVAPTGLREEGPKTLWGGKVLTDLPATSEIAFAGKVTFLPGDKQDAQAFAKSYTNEGRSWWDVSVGFQLKATKELQYNADDGVVRTKNADRQNAFGMLNFFPWKVDVRGDEHDYLRSTHFFVGVPISGKPLDNPIAGMGWGIYKTPLKVNFFAGITFTRVRDPNTLSAGQKATTSQLQSDFREHRVHKFIFGVDFPISQIKDALKKK